MEAANQAKVDERGDRIQAEGRTDASECGQDRCGDQGHMISTQRQGEGRDTGEDGV